MDSSVFVVKHSAQKEKFGTAFPVKITEDTTYFVTALHVVNRDPSGSFSVANEPIESIWRAANSELDFRTYYRVKSMTKQSLP